MTPLSCLCWRPGRPWPVADDDRYCGLCGRPLVEVRPSGLVLARDATPELALYLWGDASRPGTLGGQVELRLFGHDPSPEVFWAHEDGVPLRMVGEPRPRADGALVVPFTASASPAAPGALARGRLRVWVARRRFEFVVRAYTLDSARYDVWLNFDRDEPPPGRRLLLYRGAPPGRIWLRFALAGGVPVRWQSATSSHAAVRVEPTDDGLARPVAHAVVHWNTRRFDSESEWQKVEFQLGFQGLKPLTFTQLFGWRKERPLVCRPAAVYFEGLPADRPGVCPVELRNSDRTAVTLRRLRGDADWVAQSGNGLPLTLPPGASGQLWLELRPDRAPGPGPHETVAWLDLGARGRQPLPVLVGRFHPVEPLRGPLLIDPGPPRVVLGRVRGRGLPPVYLRCSGDTGIAPEQLGLDPASYARAAYAGRDVKELLGRLIEAARHVVLDVDHFTVGDVAMCRHGWVPEDVELPGVLARDWRLLALRGASGGPRPLRVARVDAWSAAVLALAPDGPLQMRQMLRVDALSSTLGSGVLECLDRQLGLLPSRSPGGLIGAVRSELTGDGPGPLLGLMLACDTFLRDCRWGPDHAWRRLLTWCCRSLPRARRRAGRFDLRQAQTELADFSERLLRALHERVEAVAAAGGPASWVLVGEVFRNIDLARAVKSFGPIRVVPDGWLEWLSRDAAGFDPDAPGA